MIIGESICENIKDILHNFEWKFMLWEVHEMVNDDAYQDSVVSLELSVSKSLIFI